MFSKILSILDKTASELEEKGLTKEAEMLDVISNTIEASILSGLSDMVKDNIKKLVSDPNWKETVKSFYAQKENIKGKEAASSPRPLLVALMMISTAIGAVNAEDFIDKVSKASQESSIVSEKVDTASMRGLSNAIPFDVNGIELFALPRVSKEVFENAIRKKISKGLAGPVKSFVGSSVVFKDMTPETLSRYVGEAFMLKIAEPKYSEAKNALEAYLKNNGLAGEDLKSLVVKSSFEDLKSTALKVK